jgi:single-strand DNA-binding protein
MSDTITLTGIVATLPRAITTGEGLAITSFRLASSQRRFDRAQERWVDGDTNWYTVTAFRQLATNSAVSLKKADRVVVTGRLRIRDWESGDKAGTNIDVEADAIGHDLSWGTAAFSRSMGAAPADALAATQAGNAQTGSPAEFPSEADAGSDVSAEPSQLVTAAADTTSADELSTPF